MRWTFPTIADSLGTAMLCFLPPMPAEFEGVPPARGSRNGETRAIVLVILVVVCALLAPFGTARQQAPVAVRAVASPGTGPNAVTGPGRRTGP